MRIRVRGPQGVVNLTIDDSATWTDLTREISSKTEVADFDIKYGYPPQPLDVTSFDHATKLVDLPVKLNGEQLIISPNTTQTPPKTATQSSSSTTTTHSANPLPSQPLSLAPKPRTDIESDPPEIPVPLLDGIMILRIMPDDNSCMFRALSSAVLGSSLDGMTELRSIVAQTIQAQPELYSAGLLGKEPTAYCRWIQREDSWGGGIELAILSQHFDLEICSINVQDTRVDRFNEGKPTRCVLVYSGIHYDVCAISPFSGAEPEFDRKVFDVVRTGDEEEDGGALEAARELCKVLQGRHYFTDTQKFDVKCNVCGTTGKGEKWAVQHASSTGHMDFGES